MLVGEVEKGIGGYMVMERDLTVVVLTQKQCRDDVLWNCTPEPI